MQTLHPRRTISKSAAPNYTNRQCRLALSLAPRLHQTLHQKLEQTTILQALSWCNFGATPKSTANDISAEAFQKYIPMPLHRKSKYPKGRIELTHVKLSQNNYPAKTDIIINNTNAHTAHTNAVTTTKIGNTLYTVNAIYKPSGIPLEDALTRLMEKDFAQSAEKDCTYLDRKDFTSFEIALDSHIKICYDDTNPQISLDCKPQNRGGIAI